MLLMAIRGNHTVWISINQRGSNLTDININNECLPGAHFISCIQSHPTFAKINPHLNAQDANTIISFFTQNEEITVNGQEMNAADFIPQGTARDAINLYTSSFGGVIVGYMLGEANRPPLHNVFLEQITGPREYPISSGLDNADRMLHTLFDGCERDAVCNSAYPNVRTNFRNFMNSYANSDVTVDNDAIYAGGVFDRIMYIIEEENQVGKAIRYIGEIANDYVAGSSIDVPAIYEPSSGFNNRANNLGEQPRSLYGIPSFSSSQWTTYLQQLGIDFFPGITNRTAMICSFGINRAITPDSLNRFNMVKNQQLSRDTSNSDANKKETYGYGFLVSYRTFLDICPQLRNHTTRLTPPAVSGIDAQNVIIYYGGLDIKHDFADAQELQSYFNNNKTHLIQHTYLAQGGGEDIDCLENVRASFWNVNGVMNSSNRNIVLGDNCEESNSKSASNLDGW